MIMVLKKMWHIKASKFIVFKMIFIFQVNDHDYVPRLYKFVGVVRSSRARLAQLVEHQTSVGHGFKSHNKLSGNAIYLS